MNYSFHSAPLIYFIGRHLYGYSVAVKLCLNFFLFFPHYDDTGLNQHKLVHVPQSSLMIHLRQAGNQILEAINISDSCLCVLTTTPT